jgi:hypothetical protein
MPKMNPLQEWICDTCGDKVGISDGWLEWLSGRIGPREFRITHNSRKCYQHHNKSGRSDMHLETFIGTDGLQKLLSMIDVGEILDPEGKSIGKSDLRSLVSTIRRLHIHYYEEARLYFDAARSDGYFSDQNEYSIFLPGICKAIIERYEES